MQHSSGAPSPSPTRVRHHLATPLGGTIQHRAQMDSHGIQNRWYFCRALVLLLGHLFFGFKLHYKEKRHVCMYCMYRPRSFPPIQEGNPDQMDQGTRRHNTPAPGRPIVTKLAEIIAI